MLTIYGKRQRYCDGVSRRSFLKIGAMATGLTMADVLRAQAQGPGKAAKAKAVINIYLAGGPTHMDTFDLKPAAPVEFRGEFRPIPTSVPGMEICELMPKLAQQGKRFSIVRSITGMRDEHTSTQSDSGWSTSSLSTIGGRPGVGAVMGKLQGTVHGSAPTFVALDGFGSPGFLGGIYAPYRPDGPGRANLRLSGMISEQRLNSRAQLLAKLDGIRREIDSGGMMATMDSYNERAISVITSGELADALDTNREDPRVIERYGITQGGRYSSNSRFLLARRLVDAGVRCVTLSWGGWDTHGNNFQTMRDQLPALDVGLSALLEDLAARGMLEETIVMMSGEFGRTPRINSSAGRDHWPRAAFFFVAGGGLRHGQVIGSTTRLGEEAHDRPVHLQQVFATVYRQLGVDLEATLQDPNGRPQYLLDRREVIHELV